MGQRSVMDMANQVSGLISHRLQIRGSLENQMRRSKRFLPRRVYSAGQNLVDALQMAGHPKFIARMDQAALAGNYGTMVRHLAPIGRAERRRNFLLDFAARVAFTLLLVGGLWLTAVYLAQYR